MWQDAVVYGDFKGGTVESLFEVNLVDKTTNSLKQLNKYFDQLSLLRPKHHRVDMKDVAVDTVSVAPPMPVK